MEDTYSVGASNLTKESVKSSYKKPRLLGMDKFLRENRAGYSIAEINLTCGWFNSEAAIDPKLFKGLSYNDCLVNNGDPIKAGNSVSFVYVN
ncbi:hypothetical protein SUGI_1030640 [Cryptomeria japonica]|nr:hypothetical protein SUGI_1030640 [Cryptomeria japonica]